MSLPGNDAAAGSIEGSSQTRKRPLGDFARLSQLSPKALRRYDELGLLPPARVDPDSGYRWYSEGQLDQARLVASLRQIGIPLVQIIVILGLEPEAAAEQIGAYWAGAEGRHAARRGTGRLPR
jgi:DNA-binding transcriptional MerR regulator